MSREEMLHLLDVIDQEIAYGRPYMQHMDKLRAALSEPKKCKYGDQSCPCQDGDMCHYEGENPMTPPASEPLQEPVAWIHNESGLATNGAPLQFTKDQYTPLYAHPAAPPGYVMVPVEPDEDMQQRGAEATGRFVDFGLDDDAPYDLARQVWQSMLSAAKGGE